MIIDEVVLHNFGVYRGEHVVKLTPHKNRPVVLFGALNGSGKTTFLEAMQLALYGKNARVAGRGRASYLDYLQQCINRDTPPKVGAGLQLAFRHRVDGREESLRVMRTWRDTGSGIKEHFEVSRDGMVDAVASERWQEFVEEFIPSQISDLFFFDGEKIEGLADPQRSSELLQVGLHSLLGLDMVDQLIRGLAQIERRRKTSRLAQPDQAAVQHLEKQARQVSEQLTETEHERTRALQTMEASASRIEDLEARLSAAGGDLFQRRRELDAEYRRIKAHQTDLSQKAVDHASGAAPLLLLARQISALRSHIADGNANASSPQIVALLVGRDKRLLKEIANLDVSPSVIASIRQFLKADLKRLQKDVEKSGYSIALTEMPTEETFDNIRASARDLLKEIEQSNQDLATVERNLSAVPDESRIKGIIEELEACRLEQRRSEVRGDLLEADARRLRAELQRIQAQLQKKLEEVAEHSVQQDVNDRVLRHSARSRETLARFRDEMARRHMEKLEVEITECFRRLHRKQRTRHSVSIDRDTFELQIRGAAGGLMPTSAMSAGERQLLAVSVLWALARTSGRKLPTVIDTPLGRLDGSHRQNLVQNYFPVASHQVLIFSTDEELTPKYYNQLKGSIAREYQIVFDEVTQSSRVEVGYLSYEEHVA
ncbi:DNA sulfur modification protein DndD [Burkholderia pseudomallei]|uniref:DNA sulfur modification protein DndD n=1 Tax=Burkholderia pseudomallei TaxID=28450 RepID=UPI0018C6B596|nr:DNA sulfur modification protein DndD [Burkholderia pseudomallei]